MINFYRIEHPDGRSLYVDNDDFLEKAGMMDHHYSDFHKGIFEVIRNEYYEYPFELTNSLKADESIIHIVDEYYNTIYPYLKSFQFPLL